MLDYGHVVCFAAYFFVFVLNRFISTYKDAAGLWHEDRYRALITAIINVSLNLMWVNRWGLYGILLSTVLSMSCVGIPWMLHVLFTRFFNREQLAQFLRTLFGFIAATAFSGLLVAMASAQIQLAPLPKLMISAVIAVLIPNLIFLTCFRKNQNFRLALVFADKLTRGRLGLTRLLTEDGKAANTN